MKPLADWLNRTEIQKKAMEVLEAKPEGIRWTHLLKAVEAQAGSTPHNSVHGGVHALLVKNAERIIKVSRGVYRLSKFVEAEVEAPSVDPDQGSGVSGGQLAAVQGKSEIEFYASFAEWLEANDEATVAIPIGGAKFGGKWGTPDVLGVLKPRAQDIFKFEPQIIAAEIKVVTNQPIVAFGQAVAYRLFAHKSYIVIPTATGDDDMDRIVSLCQVLGIGLVVFNLDEDEPGYAQIVRPEKSQPDTFYVNFMLDRLKATDSKALNRLF